MNTGTVRHLTFETLSIAIERAIPLSWSVWDTCKDHRWWIGVGLPSAMVEIRDRFALAELGRIAWC